METKDKKYEIDLLDIETINELEQIELRGGGVAALSRAIDNSAQIFCNVDQCNCNTCK